MDDQDTQKPENQGLRALQKQTIVGMIAAAVLCGLIGSALWYGADGTLFVTADRYIDTSDRLAYVAKWSMVPAIFLMMGVGMIANKRFFTDDIDPLAGPNDRELQIWQRYTQNTLEQGFLLIVGFAAFAHITYPYWLRLIPIIAILFGIGRILFIIGYLIKPTFRATGFGMTFYPIVILYAITVYQYIYV